MRIGLDIDGVIRPWHVSMYRYFQVYKGYGGDEREFWDYFRGLEPYQQDYYVSIPLMYSDTSPTKDVTEYVPKLAELGEIFYITSCPHEIRLATSKFFDNYGLPFKENIIFSKDKSNYIRLNRIDYFLDDLAHNVEAVQNLTRAFLFKAAHNWRDRDRFNVINSIKEYYELIKENQWESQQK